VSACVHAYICTFNTVSVMRVLIMQALSEIVLSRCNKSSAQKYVNDLMTAMYKAEYMASHSLGGTSSKESSKIALPVEDIGRIIGTYDYHSNYIFPNTK